MAVMLGLFPLLVIEGVCRQYGWGRPELHDDPFVGFRSILPLFVLNRERSRYEIPAARQEFFRPESFPAVKRDGECRIFCLGGSTVQGRPFAVETSFTTWLELSLSAADPSRTWNVINCGGVSYASYRLIPILKEVLGYEPDLIIVYTGHNEFLEARPFDHVMDRGSLVNNALAVASRLRTFTLIREQYLRLRNRSSTGPVRGRPILPTEVEALLDYRGGLEEYHCDDEWRKGVIEHFSYNLHSIVQLVRSADTHLLLINPVSNLRDCPPFKSQHRDDLTPEEKQRWESLCRTARRYVTASDSDVATAIAALQQACMIDPQHAMAHYHLGHCYVAAGRSQEAHRAFWKAQELDICPLRMLQAMNDAVLEIARSTETPVLDAQSLFEKHSREGLTGDEWLLDHVHPSIIGHQLLADALTEELTSMGLVHISADWIVEKQERYRDHFESLSDLYFLKGAQRLKAVRDWAQGRATRLRPKEQSAK